MEENNHENAEECLRAQFKEETKTDYLENITGYIEWLEEKLIDKL